MLIDLLVLNIGVLSVTLFTLNSSALGEKLSGRPGPVVSVLPLNWKLFSWLTESPASLLHFECENCQEHRLTDGKLGINVENVFLLFGLQ